MMRKVTWYIHIYKFHLDSFGRIWILFHARFPLLSGRSRGTTNCKKRSLCCRRDRRSTLSSSPLAAWGLGNVTPEVSEREREIQMIQGKSTHTHTGRSLMNQAGAYETKLMFSGTALYFFSTGQPLDYIVITDDVPTRDWVFLFAILVFWRVKMWKGKPTWSRKVSVSLV